jgi:hypothetical protein
MNTRRYPRTLSEAFGPYTDDRLQPMPTRSKVAEFFIVYRQYRFSHSRRYALKLAYEIAFKNLPF